MKTQTKPKEGRRYGGLSDGERRAERHARLLSAGFELFGTEGFGNTTIPMLCSRAGVTARHFYEEFDSREAVLRELFDTIADEAIEGVRGSLKTSAAAASTPYERIRASNVSYFGYMTGDPRRARIYALESLGVSEELERHRRAKRESFVKLINPDQTHVPAPLDSRLLSIAVSGAAHALLLDWVLASQQSSLDTLVDTLTIIWMRTLKLER